MFQKKQIDHTVVAYRQCFTTDAGRLVLANLLMEAKFFDYTTTPEEQAVENFMKTILHKAGLYSVDNIDEYVTVLFNLKISG